MSSKACPAAGENDTPLTPEQELLLERLNALRKELRVQYPHLDLLSGHLPLRLAHVFNGMPVPVALTDFEGIYFNPDVCKNYDDEQLLGLLVHEKLHVGLDDNQRIQWRDPKLWNVAADYRINAMVEQYALPGRQVIRARLPFGGLVDSRFEGLSAEEIYALLLEEKGQNGSDGDSDGEDEGDLVVSRTKKRAAQQGEINVETGERDLSELARKAAQRREEALQALEGTGTEDPGLKRETVAARPKVPWTDVLQRFLTRTTGDFTGWRRALVHRGLYLEDDSTEGLSTAIFVDTSKSIKDGPLGQSLIEVRAALRSVPVGNIHLYYGDVRLYGPYEMSPTGPFPIPQGGGGTDFRPFFKATENDELRVVITDGRGVFPKREPMGQTLWIIQPGGRPTEEIPFGFVIRMESWNKEEGEQAITRERGTTEKAEGVGNLPLPI